MQTLGRPKAMHFKEDAGPKGRLHLNILSSWEWISQALLSELAAASGFGPVCHISRIGRGARGVELSQSRPGSSAAISYAAKTGFRVVAYARKTGSQTAGLGGDDWPRKVRRWSATRAASREMGPRPSNPDWYWSALEPRPPEAPAMLSLVFHDEDRKWERPLFFLTSSGWRVSGPRGRREGLMAWC